MVYRGTSLTRKSTPLGPYCRPMPRVMRVIGGWAFSYGRGTPVRRSAPAPQREEARRLRSRPPPCKKPPPNLTLQFPEPWFCVCGEVLVKKPIPTNKSKENQHAQYLETLLIGQQIQFAAFDNSGCWE